MRLSRIRKRFRQAWETKRQVLSGGKHALPDFLIIGAQKAGTTSLYEYLKEHPAMRESRRKEVHYFDKTFNFKHGLNWYRSNFPLRDFKKETVDGIVPITGEATPQYLFHPHAARRAHDVVPNAKIIVLLRNPIDRAYSHYNVRERRAKENLTFEQALAAEEQRLRPELERMLADEYYYSFAYQLFSYQWRGHYAEQLEKWFVYFPRNKFLILKSEDMFADPQRTFDEVLAFLGLPPHQLKQVEAFNSASRLGAEYGGMKQETYQQLAEYFAPHNKKLYELLNRDFGWEDKS